MKITVADDRPAFLPVLLAGLVAGVGTLLAQSGLVAIGFGSGGLTSLAAIGLGLFVGLVARGPIEGAFGAGDGTDEDGADGDAEVDAAAAAPGETAADATRE